MIQPIGNCLDNSQIEDLRARLLQAHQVLSQQPQHAELVAELSSWAETLNGAPQDGEFDLEFIEQELEKLAGTLPEKEREELASTLPLDETERIAEKLCWRAVAIGFEPDEIIWTFTWEDIIICLAQHLYSEEVDPDELSDQDLRDLLYAGDNGLKGEGLDWSEVIRISFDEDWPPHLRKPYMPYAQVDFLGLFSTHLFWKCECGRINTFREDRCPVCHASRFVHNENVTAAEVFDAEAEYELPADLVVLVRSAVEELKTVPHSDPPDGWLEQAYEDRNGCGGVNE